jgi:peptidoglycan/LPS O-acetylase OafA/YrhL
VEGFYGVSVWAAVESSSPEFAKRNSTISDRFATEEFPDAAHRPSARDLPSLDGLRALSIAFVLVGHASHDLPGVVETLLARLAHFGVCVFFVISGYLITTLLWRDIQKRGEVQLTRFYLRRTLRIFPPYYVYLAVVAIGVSVWNWPTPLHARWWPAFTYLSNFANTNWAVTGHSWSLSMEEQFYVTWPFVLSACVRGRGVAAGGRTACIVALAGLIVFPLTRIAVFALSRSGELTGAFMFDYVAAGSAIALFLETSRGQQGQRALGAALSSGMTPLVFGLALALHLAFAGTTRWFYAIDIGVIMPLEAALLAVFIAWAVRNPQHAIGRVLNARALRVIGVGSYSLYLWQQLFFAPGAAFAHEWSVSLRLTAACAFAGASYFLVERPSLHLRTRIERALFDRVVTPS